MASIDKPWHQPGKWLVNPAYWDDESLAARSAAPKRIQFIDCTLSEGDDCVGHQLNWNTRLGLIERLDAVGVGEITLPSHATFSEERDMVKACRRMGVRTRLVAKGPGVKPPLKGDWRSAIDRHIDLGAEVISPIVKWDYADTLSDFSGDLSKQMVVDAITESIAYMKRQTVRVVPWMVDSMRSPVDTACLFFKAMADAGADGVYVVDSRGNSAPLATRTFIGRVRRAVGDKCDVYVQHHNDLGVATANAMAAVEGGANWIDASVIGIGDRGGCVALEEAAALFEMYGIATGVKLDALYELCRYVQKAYGIQLRRGNRLSARTGTRRKASAIWKAAPMRNRRSGLRRKWWAASSKPSSAARFCSAASAAALTPMTRFSCATSCATSAWKHRSCNSSASCRGRAPPSPAATIAITLRSASLLQSVAASCSVGANRRKD
jgi:hypothetical protein